MGDTTETAALIFEVTEITIFKGVTQPFNAICVKVMVAPDGQVVQPKLAGPKLVLPPGAVVGAPLPPNDVVQLREALGVAVTEKELDAPAQSEAVAVLAVGGAFTVTVEFTAGPLQPLRTGLTVY